MNGLGWWIVVPRYTEAFFFFKMKWCFAVQVTDASCSIIKACCQPILKNDFYQN
jgi:hypothetical protein